MQRSHGVRPVPTTSNHDVPSDPKRQRQNVMHNQEHAHRSSVPLCVGTNARHHPSDRKAQSHANRCVRNGKSRPSNHDSEARSEIGDHQDDRPNESRNDDEPPSPPTEESRNQTSNEQSRNHRTTVSSLQFDVQQPECPTT